MNFQQSSIQAAKELINNNPTLFNKFANKELQVTIIAAAMLQFSIDCDKNTLSELENETNSLPPIFQEIINNFNNPLKQNL